MNIVITLADVGRHVFTRPDVFGPPPAGWLENPTYEIDTEVVILQDDETGKLGYVYVRNTRDGDFQSTRNATMWLIDDGDPTLYATQEDAIRDSIQVERDYATDLLRACDMFVEKLDRDRLAEREKLEAIEEAEPYRQKLRALALQVVELENSPGKHHAAVDSLLGACYDGIMAAIKDRV